MALPTKFVTAARLRASCKIFIAGQDVTAKFDPHLLSVTITKVFGYEIGEAQIELDDRYGMLRLPTSHDPCYIELGWPGENSFKVFTGQLADITSRGQRRRGRTLQLKVEEASTIGGLKSPVNGSWGDGRDKKAKVGDVLQELAKGLKVKINIDPTIAAKELPFIMTSTESFFQFIQRISREVGAVPSIVGDTVGVVAKDSTKNALGQDMESIDATVGRNVLAWSIKPLATRPQWASVGRIHFDPAKAKFLSTVKDITNMEGGFYSGVTSKFTSQFLAATETNAKELTESESQDSVNGRGTGWIVIDGEPKAEPGALLQLSGARGGVDGSYKMVEIEHSYSRGAGFTTRIQLDRPQGVGTVTGAWE